MNGKEFQKHLTSAIPDVPEHFHNRMEMTLESIVNQEAHMKESTKTAIRTAMNTAAPNTVCTVH